MRFLYAIISAKMADERSSPGDPRNAFAPTMDGGGTAPAAVTETQPTVVVASADEETSEPSRIGRYLILRCIGRGGMGVVYLAYDADLDRQVALKLVRNGKGQDSVGRARIKQEAQAMAKVAHPNIVHVYEVGESDGQLFIAMEYVAGVTLSGWRARSDLAMTSIQQTIRVYLQAAAGLSAAHQAGLIHRDFKPDNVLVDSEGRARVLDFGIARALDGSPVAAAVERQATTNSRSSVERLTQAGAILGTPGYMSPEQVRGAETDASTDQFSFCAALYEALHRQLPFAGDSFEEFSRELLAGRLRPPPSKEVPLLVERALKRGLALDPAARYPSMQELIRDIEAGLDPDSESAVNRSAGRWTAGLVIGWTLLTGLAGARGALSRSDDIRSSLILAIVATIGFLLSFLVFRKQLMSRDTTRRLVYFALVELSYLDSVRFAGYWLQLPPSRYIPVELLGIGALHALAAPQLSWRLFRLVALCGVGSLLIIKWPQLRFLSGALIYPLVAFGGPYYALTETPRR